MNPPPTPPSEPTAADWWAAAAVLAGLRYDKETLAALFRDKLPLIRQSWIYQVAAEEGARPILTRMLLRLGAERLGPPNETALASHPSRVPTGSAT